MLNFRTAVKKCSLKKSGIKINKRMNAILVEIDKLKEIEKTWNEFPDGTEETNKI